MAKRGPSDEHEQSEKATAILKVSAQQFKEAAQKAAQEAAQKSLNVLQESDNEPSAVVALWPEAIRELNEEERKRQTRLGSDTVLFDDPQTQTIRGFVRAVLRIPLSEQNNDAAVYGVFVEVGKEEYLSLQKAHREKSPTRVWGKLATRLPLLEDAFESRVELFEDGSELRARIVGAENTLLIDGPTVGPLPSVSF